MVALAEGFTASSVDEHRDILTLGGRDLDSTAHTRTGIACTVYEGYVVNPLPPDRGLIALFMLLIRYAYRPGQMRVGKQYFPFVFDS